jgi:hypothetical protein
VINYNPIQKLKLDIEFIGIKESNNYLFDKASNLSKGDITQVLSDFFDDPKFEHLIYQFNSLEFDLGTIPYNNFEATFIERFKIQLSKKFADIFENNKDSEAYNLKSNETNLLELIKFYLLNGRLPWWSNKLGVNSISNVINEFINTNPNEFRSLLLEIGKNENVRKRIAYTFREDLIKLVIKVLSPAEFEYIFVYHDYILKLNNEYRLISEPASTVSKAVWYNIITYILTEQSSDFEKKEFLKRNLRMVSAYFNINFYNLLQLLNDASIETHHSLNADLYNFIKDIQFIYQEERENNGTKFPVPVKRSIINNDANYELDELYFNYLYVINYYLTNGSLPVGYNIYRIEDLKQFLYKLYAHDVNIVTKLLLNINIKSGTTNRIFQILSSTNYKFAIDIILKKYLNIDLNDIHKTFIQLRINNNRSTTLYLSDDWKKSILNLVYTQKDAITVKHLFEIYLSKYASAENISINTAIDIYVKDLRLQNNHSLLNQLIESQNIIIENRKVEDIDNIAQSNSVYDLIQYIIEFGFMPWWGIDLVQVSFRTTFEKHFNANSSDYIKLLRYAGNTIPRKSRFFNLFGNEKIEFLLFSQIEDKRSIDLYHFFKNYLTSNIDNFKQNNIVDILWITLITSNYKQLDTTEFIRNVLIRLNHTKPGNLNIYISDIVEQLKSFDASYISYLNDFSIYNTGDVGFNDELLNTYKKELALILQENNYTPQVLERFILILANESYSNDSNVINSKTIHLIHNILNDGNFPSDLSKYPAISAEMFLFTLLEYFYTKSKEQLKNILLKFDSFNATSKNLMIDWLFTKSQLPFISFIAETILPLNSTQYQFLTNTNLNANFNLSTDKKFNANNIAALHKSLQVQITSTNVEIYDKYSDVLKKYLVEEKFESQFENQDDILKFLIISIYSKGASFLLNIFNSQYNSITAKKRILSLFSNPINFQERQIYSTLLSSIENNNLFIDDFMSNSILDIQSIEVENQTLRTDLKSSILDYFNLKSLTDKTYLDKLKSILISYLSSSNEFISFQNYFKEDFDYYLKLIFLEIVKNAPSDLFTLLRNTSNQRKKVLYAYQLFIQDNTSQGLITLNVFADYFEEYLTKNVFKSNNIEKEVNNLIINQKDLNSNDIQYLINSNLPLNQNISLIDSLDIIPSEQISLLNKTLLKIVLFEIKKSYSNLKEQQKFDLIVSRTILNNIENIKSAENINEYLFVILNVLNKEPLDSDSTYLDSIVKRFETTNIAHPYSLVKLVKFVADKGRKIINGTQLNTIHKTEISQKDKHIIENTRQIKIQHESEKRKAKDQHVQETLLNEKNKNESVTTNEPIYVNNIGLVLFHLFIPTYFKRLNLLNDEGEFIDIDAQYKAVHLLQILASDAKYDEHELVLNKILCNLEISETIPMDVELSEAETNLAMELNKVVLQRWEKMSNSSIEHFRAAFIMRDGRLILKEDGWYLTVEKRGYDIILSTIPWAFGVVKFKWMPKFLYTEWT